MGTSRRPSSWRGSIHLAVRRTLGEKNLVRHLARVGTRGYAAAAGYVEPGHHERGASTHRHHTVPLERAFALVPGAVAKPPWR